MSRSPLREPDRDAPAAAPKLDTLAERVWYAWHCLPRAAYGKPPSWRGLEHDHSLPPGVFSALMAGHRHSVEVATGLRMAAALRVGVAWLLFGEGEAPKLTGALSAPEDRDSRDPRKSRERLARYLSAKFPADHVEAALRALFPEEAK